MECYQTCVDQGNRCFFSKEKLTCIDCGRFRRGYNVPTSRCTTCQQTSCCKCPEVRCECAEVSCLEWFLSLFGLGQKRATKDTCTSTQAKAGETTAQASETEPLEIAVCRSKEGFSVTLQRIGSKHKCERSSKTSIPFEQNREAEKKFKLDDSFPDHRNPAAVSVPPTAAAAEEDRKKSGDEKHRRRKSKEKSPKWTSSNSSTESRGRSRRKRKKSRSRSGSASKSKEVVHGNKVLSASSSGSRTGKGRSRSCSSSICSCSPIFKPYRHKYSFLKCSSYTPQTSPVHICTTSPSAVEPTLGQKYSRAPSKPCPYALTARTLQPSDCSPPREPKPCESNAEPETKKKSGVIQSASMSCGTEAKRCCTRGVAKPTMYPIYNPPCPYFCKLPCRSQSFHTTMVSGPSPRAVCIPNRISCCCPEVTCGRSRCRTPKLNGGNRKSRSCPRSCPCPIKSSCCSPPPCFKACCPKPCACIAGGKNCTCCCVTGCKAIPCPPTCTKPCCLPCPRQFQVIPYCPRPTPSDRVYSSLSKCIKGSSCPCPPSSCLCAKPGKSPTRPCCSQLASVNKPLCCTGFTASYIKSKQGDTVCQQLLNKYGFSTVSNKCRPPICTGMTFCPNPCNTNLCKKMTRPGCMCNLPLGPETKSCCAARSGGCRSCRPCMHSPGHPSACEPAENYTNSRKPTSPSEKRKQIIQFKNEPCDKPPRCEFYLAPHCLRKTGPRSPVKEYMYKMCIPKKTARQDTVEEAQLPLEVVAEPVDDKAKVKEIEVQEVTEDKEDKEAKEEEKVADAENEPTDKENIEEPGKESGEVTEQTSVSKKKKRRGSKVKAKGKAVTDENASAVSGTQCSEEEEVTHDVMIFYCALSPPATVKESLDEEHLEMYKNNNHGCESCVPRHAHFTQSKYYPGFRHESSSYDPHGNNYPLSMSSFLKSRELRPTYDIYRLGTYAGPSFGFSTSCYNRPNDKRTIFDEKLFCTSRLSKNWNVNALGTTKFRTATYKAQRPSNPTVYRNFPKAIICSKLETEIQRKIQQIKIADCKARSGAWRKQHVDTIPVSIPMLPDTGSQYSKEDEGDAEQDNAVGDASHYKHSMRPSVFQQAPRPSYVTSAYPSVRASVYQDAKESIGQSGEPLPDREEDNRDAEAEKKDSCASFVCVTCDDNDNDAKQTNCNHDVSSVTGCSNASLPSEEAFFRKDILSPEKSAVPAAVPLVSSNVKDTDGAGHLQYGIESSVDGAMYEFSQRSSPEEVADTTFLLEDKSGNACIKKQQDSPIVDICVTSEETPDEKPENFVAQSEETSGDNNTPTPVVNAVGVSEILADAINFRRETEICEIKTVEQYQVTGEISHTSAPSSTVSSSFSSVTMTCSTTISMAARSSIASVSNADLMNAAARDKAGVVKRISSIRKRPGSNFGIGRGDSPARNCETPIKYLVRNAFVPRDGSDLFLMNESRLRSPHVGSRTNSRLHSDAESFVDRPFSRVSEALDSRCRDVLVSGSSVDPVETSGNESQNHRSETDEVFSPGTEETDQLLSSSNAQVTESLVKGTLTIIHAFLKPDEPLACLQMDVNIEGAAISIDVVRLYGTPV